MEIAASGFTKEMDEDLNEMLHKEKASSSEDEDDDSEEDFFDAEAEAGNDKEDKTVNSVAEDTAEVKSLQEQVSSAMAELNVKEDGPLEDKDKVPELDLPHSSKRVDSCSESVAGLSMISRSTAATIAPEVIRDRLKKTYHKSDKMQAKKRIQAKGEASAVSRQRRENRDTIKQSQGIWG